MIIAIDSTARGPAIGGCRWQRYASSLAARRDAQALASTMTRKAAMARLSLGGGKAVVVGNPAERTREGLLAFGDFVNSLGGRYITGPDMGTSEAEMAVIHEETSWVAGVPRKIGGSGDPGPSTARGVVLAMARACEHLGRPLRGARVAVQGVGNVGGVLVELLLEHEAEVSAADPRPEALEGLPAEVVRLAPEQIIHTSCDVFAPCAAGGVIDASVAEQIDCRAVCGAANNPLGSDDAARVLADRGILYVPDVVANAGGLIHLAVALDGGDDATARRHLAVIPENLDAVLFHAKSEQVDNAAAVEQLALARLGTHASSF